MTVNLPLATQRRLDESIDRLAAEHAGVFSRETVERFVSDSVDRLGEVSVFDYLPLITERFARERLRACAQAEGLLTKTQPEVLFVCVHNAGRSQMAAALTDHISEGRVSVRSAGSAPAQSIEENVVLAMAEIGLDVCKAFPKPLTDEVVRAADTVVTMGCGDACPVYPGRRYLDWKLDDPAGQDLATVRRIRDDIAEQVKDLLDELLP
jgi:arsenate reductase (thioredoxin)